jgi:hypothetical protein
MSDGLGPDEDGQRCKRLGLWRVAVIAEAVMRRAIDEPQNRAAAGTPTIERIDACVSAPVSHMQLAWICSPGPGSRCSTGNARNRVMVLSAAVVCGSTMPWRPSSPPVSMW